MDISEVLTTVLYNDAPVTFSGGDPIYQAEAILPLARAIREAGLGIDDVPATVLSDFLALVDVLVDGPFIAEKKDLTLLFRGSTNQRLIDMRRTLASGEIVEFTPESVW